MSCFIQQNTGGTAQVRCCKSDNTCVSLNGNEKMTYSSAKTLCESHGDGTYKLPTVLQAITRGAMGTGDAKDWEPIWLRNRAEITLQACDKANVNNISCDCSPY